MAAGLALSRLKVLAGPSTAAPARQHHRGPVPQRGNLHHAEGQVLPADDHEQLCRVYHAELHEISAANANHHADREHTCSATIEQPDIRGNAPNIMPPSNADATPDYAELDVHRDEVTAGRAVRIYQRQAHADPRHCPRREHRSDEICQRNVAVGVGIRGREHALDGDVPDQRAQAKPPIHDHHLVALGLLDDCATNIHMQLTDLTASLNLAQDVDAMNLVTSMKFIAVANFVNLRPT